MKNFFKNIKNKAVALFTKAQAAVETVVKDVKGDLATNTIGAIIVAVVVIGLLITAINAFFPTFFTDMFGSMKDKLNGNW